MRDKKLKVLLVHSTLHVGGAEEVSANICRRINRDEFDVHACFLKEKGVIAEKIESEGTTVHAVGDPARTRPDYLTWWKLRKLVAREQFQIIHSHDVHSLVDGSICRLVSPGLRHVHTFHFGNYPERETDLRRLERVTWRIPDRLVAVSEHQRQGIRELYGIPDDRIETVWNGVDVLPPIQPVPEIERYRGKAVIIGSVNTLIRQKGMPELVRAARLLKEKTTVPFVFIIAGGGVLLDELRALVAEQGVEQEVIFLDWVKQAPQCVLPYVDIFFQPSNWEAMSIVLLEAMALRKPVVATTVGETPRIITDSENGMLVARGNVTAMADALQKLVENEGLRKTLGSRASQHYETNFTASCLARRHEELYRSLVR